jgi:hypothetical protein
VWALLPSGALCKRLEVLEILSMPQIGKHLAISKKYAKQLKVSGRTFPWRIAVKLGTTLTLLGGTKRQLPLAYALVTPLERETIFIRFGVAFHP